MSEIVNKVAESGIMTIDLSKYIPAENSVHEFDLKPFLFREMILREKDFRTALKEYDWSNLAEKQVAVYCSADAIIPMWAYMLVTSYLEDNKATAFFGTKEELEKTVLIHNISQIDLAEYDDKRVILKGCGDKSVPETAYVAATQLLKPVVKSLMYGEPCSTVPIYKKKVVR